MKRLITSFYSKQKIIRRLFRQLPNHQRVKDIEQFMALLGDSVDMKSGFRSLDLGSGLNPRNPFGAREVFGVDLFPSHLTNVRVADLAVDPIPFPAEFFHYVTAFDFIEHIPRVAHLPAMRFPFVELMNEVWRILKPSGLFLMQTPVYPFLEVFQDPTHVNVISHNTFTDYFDDKKRGARFYGFTGAFKVRRECLKGSHLISLLEKVDVENPG